MTIEKLTVLNAMVRKVDWLEARQKTLAENVANADTPNTRPMDIAPLDFSDLMSKTSSGIKTPKPTLATTSAAHMSLDGGSSGADPKGKAQRVTYETSPSGNAIVLEEQLLKMGENFTDHRMMTNLYQKNIDMLKQSTK